DEVVDVLQLTAAHVERVAAEAGALRDDHAAGLLGLDLELGRDRVGAVADARRDRLRDLGSAGVVDVLAAGLRALGPLGAEDLDRPARLEREGVVRPSLGPPERDQLLQLLWMLLGEVRALARIDVSVEELPLLLVEVPPRFRRRGDRGRG